MIIQQRPFAYLPKEAKKPPKPLNYKWEYLPSNYVAICRHCLRPYQKLPKESTCTRCNECCVVILLPELLPWRLLPPRSIPMLPRLRGYLAENTPFFCNLCGVRYGSIAIFVTLCKHKGHSNLICRFCCKDKSAALMKALDNLVASKHDKSSPSIINLRDLNTFYLRADTFGRPLTILNEDDED